MAYSDQKMSGGKIWAMAIVALIHVALGYAFVTGLATNFVKKATEKLNTFDVEEPPPPPPDEPPPPPPDTPMTPPPVVSPPPIVTNPNPPPVTIATVPNPAPVYVPTVVAAPPAPPPAPTAPVASKAAGLKGNPAQFFGADNYPPAAIRAEESGRVVAKLTVGTDGRVTDCVVTTSSNSSSLDQATCRIARSRVRFSPALGQGGEPIVSSYTLPVRWVLPEN